MKNPLTQPMSPKVDRFAGWFVAVLLVGPIVAGFVGLCVLVVAPFVEVLGR